MEWGNIYYNIYLEWSPTQALSDIIFYAAWIGLKPKATILKIFGCIGFAIFSSQNMPKLDDNIRFINFIILSLIL